MRTWMNTFQEFRKNLLNSRKRSVGFLLLVLLPSVSIILITLLSSIHFMQTITLQPVSKPVKTTKKAANDSLYGIPGKPVLDREIINLEITEYFWKNRLKTAKKDSITLSIDLIDSIVYLDIRGVPVRECKIKEYEISALLRYARDKGVLATWFADTFVLQDYWATLPKAPIKIKEAPADTNEAKEMVDANPPVEKQDVRFILQLNKNLIIQVDQTETFVFTGWFEKHFRNLQFRIEKGIQFVYTLLKLKWPEPELRIKIKLSQSDAKSIFRALPQRAETIVRF